MAVLPQLFSHSESSRLGSDRDLRRAFARGEYLRLGSGVYVSTSEWSSLDADERYRARVRAAALRSRPKAQFSHESAAAMWRLPSIGPWPTIAHELTDRGPGGTSRVGIRRHGLGLDPEPQSIDGVTITSLARTVVDVACTTSFVRAVAMLDCAQRTPDPREPRWGLPWATSAEVFAQLDTLGNYKGSARARRACEFSDALSGSPGESLARVQFRALGLPAPELQVEFFDELGSIGFADFFWRDIGLIGEFDGISKYGARRHFQTGLGLEEIIMREKAREDRMRAVCNGFVRLGWALVSDRRGLASELARHGLHV